MRFKIQYLIPILILSQNLYAQTDEDPNAALQQQNVNTTEELKSKLGVKFTYGGHTFLGNAFDNRKLKFAFGVGVYHIIPLNKEKSVSLQWEFNLTFKGCKFGKQNDTSYSKISLAYMELPVYFSTRLTNNKNKKNLDLLTGIQVGYLFLSSVNKNYGELGEVKTNLPFKKFDLMPAIGFRQGLGQGISMQLCFKYGLLNNYTDVFRQRTINPNTDIKNEDYSDLTPAFKDGTHKNRNMGFELSIQF